MSVSLWEKRTDENIPRTVFEISKSDEVGGMCAGGVLTSDGVINGAGVVGGVPCNLRLGVSSRVSGNLNSFRILGTSHTGHTRRFSS